MKKLIKPFLSTLAMLAFGAVALSAQSCAATDTSGRALTHAANASGEASSAAGGSVVGSVQAASAVAAVPLWVGGSTVATVGDSLAHGGTTTMKGAEKMWDFASGDPAQRPALDREKCVPPAAPKTPVRAKDPSPADAFKTKL